MGIMMRCKRNVLFTARKDEADWFDVAKAFDTDGCADYSTPKPVSP
jgi:hypothetical protein